MTTGPLAARSRPGTANRIRTAAMPRAFHLFITMHLLVEAFVFKISR
jgi:hypothetical protein